MNRSCSGVISCFTDMYLVRVVPALSLTSVLHGERSLLPSGAEATFEACEALV